jgi:ribosome-associated protein
MADLAIRPGLLISERLLSWRFSRSGGPGGQSVNTSDTRVELRLDLAQLPEPFRTRALSPLPARLVDETVLAVTASDERSQLRNREAAEARMAEILRRATAAPPRPRRATKPSRGSVERRLADKRRRGNVKRTRRDGTSDE